MEFDRQHQKSVRPAKGGGISLVVSEAVNAADGRSLDVVAQEKTVVTPGTSACLLQHH